MMYIHSSPEAEEPTDNAERQDVQAPAIEATATEEEIGKPSRLRAWLLDIYMALLMVVAFSLDQATKQWVRSNLLPGGSIPDEGLFRITHAFNTGSAFGLFPNQTTLLMVASIVGIGVLLLFYRNQSIPGVWLRTSLGLQLGGAAGNLVDRIVRGQVTDFIDIGLWPIFNLADSFILVGLGILAWFLLKAPKEKAKGQQPPPLEEGPPDADGQP